MEFTENNKIFGIPVMQNQQEFIVGVFKIRDILSFTKYTKRVIRDFDEVGLPIYNNEIQREVEQPRVEKIADFLINDPEATFPTNLVLHIPEEIILSQHRKENFLEIIVDPKVLLEVKKEQSQESTGDIYISIIDGQHRLSGIETAIKRLRVEIDSLNKALSRNPNSISLNDKLDYYSSRLTDLLKIELVVTFFVAKRIEYQAMIFSTINRTQKRVSENLVYSLFGLSVNDSPQKTALQVVLSLNAHPYSPFYNRVKLYGGDYERNQSPPLSQATMVKTIVNLISENLRESENDRYKKRSELENRTPGSNKYLAFRNYYAKNADNKISDILFYYFSAIKKSFEINEISFWDFDPEKMKPNNVLHTTVGFQSLMDTLVDILPSINEKDRYNIESYKTITDKFSDLPIRDIKRYPFTSKSRNIFYLDISLKINPASSDNDSRLIKLLELLKDNK